LEKGRSVSSIVQQLALTAAGSSIVWLNGKEVRYVAVREVSVIDKTRIY
jgi:hypothetical protein